MHEPHVFDLHASLRFQYPLDGSVRGTLSAMLNYGSFRSRSRRTSTSSAAYWTGKIKMA